MKEQTFEVFTQTGQELIVRAGVSRLKPPEPDDALSTVRTDFELSKPIVSNMSNESQFGFAIPIQLDMTLAYNSETELTDFDKSMLEEEGWSSDDDFNTYYEARVVYAGYLKVACFTDNGYLTSAEKIFDDVHFVSNIEDEFYVLNNEGIDILHLDQDAYPDDVDIFKDSIRRYAQTLNKTEIQLEIELI